MRPPMRSRLIKVSWKDGGVGVPKRQAGGAHLTTSHPPVVSAARFLSRLCCLLCVSGQLTPLLRMLLDSGREEKSINWRLAPYKTSLLLH